MSDIDKEITRMSKGSSYYEKLQSPRWQRKRLTILRDRKWECEYCGDTEKQLHVHHNFYISGKEPWQYSSRQLTVLCVDCHKAATENLRELREALSFLTPDLVPLVLGFVNAVICCDDESIPCRSHEEAMGIASFCYVRPFQIDEVMGRTNSKTNKVRMRACYPGIFLERM